MSPKKLYQWIGRTSKEWRGTTRHFRAAVVTFSRGVVRAQSSQGRKIAGASVFRGIEGYGSDRVFHTAKILELSTTLPVKIEVVDEAEKIDAILLEITPIVHKGLITVSDTVVVKHSRK